MTDNYLNDVAEPGCNDDEKTTAKDNQGIFDKRFDAVTNELAEKLVNSGVEAHIIIFKNPETGMPIIQWNGSTYEVAKMLARVKSEFAAMIAQELDL